MDRDGEKRKSSISNLKRRMIRMINDLKEDIQKQVNEIKEGE
jgi:hypothetical protein